MVRKTFLMLSPAVTAVIVVLAVWWPNTLWAFVIAGPLIALGVHDLLQRKRSLLRVYPVVGHGRFLMESMRPEIQQYFVESNLDGSPYNREFRSLIYQRAKGDLDTMPFGTQRDVQRVGYEWLNHSLAPKPVVKVCSRVQVGGPDCKKPYLASRLNISAMSFGALSRNAILALNQGAKDGGFAHNTGEGGISEYHLERGGDLIWQIGTGYFGCRTADGNFDADRFAELSKLDVVKMIEIKLSQGAKPAHGGILPAAKLTAEIAQIRGVPMGQDVNSPPAHGAFCTPRGLLEFVANLREVSGGKPIGFKLCIGHRSEFLAICKAMLDTGITPDFITVDGAEGGTGAAPVELTNSVGTPLRHALLFVSNALVGIGLRSQIRIIAAGKIATGFHMFRAQALGADMCNSARAMMFALGCIQARTCNSNKCPVGIATQDPQRAQAVNVEHKASRVTRYHEMTTHGFCELVGATGLDNADDIHPRHVWRQLDPVTVRNLADVYPRLEAGCLLIPDSVPQDWGEDWRTASADTFAQS